MYTYIPSLPSHPSESSQSPSWAHVLYSSLPLAIHFTHGSEYVIPKLPIYPILPFPCVHLSLLYVCISIPDLQIGSFCTIFLNGT